MTAPHDHRRPPRFAMVYCERGRPIALAHLVPEQIDQLMDGRPITLGLDVFPPIPPGVDAMVDLKIDVRARRLCFGGGEILILTTWPRCEQLIERLTQALQDPVREQTYPPRPGYAWLLTDLTP